MYTEWKAEVYYFNYIPSINIRVYRIRIDKDDKPFIAWFGLSMKWPFMYYQRQA